MGFNIVLTGMVLSAIPVGEYDKRITILTKERGKITAFAKGARRSGNQLLAAANPFAFGQFEVYQGKSTYTAVRAEIKNYFRELAEDFDMVCYGYYFLEVAEYYAQENADEVERLRLLYQTLRALESRKFSFALIRGIYELKTLTIGGEYPNVFECLSCGAKEHLDYFSMRLRGCVCANCQSNVGGSPLGGSTLYALQYVISAPVEKLYTFRLAPAVEEEFLQLLRSYRNHYVGHTFKSEKFLP
ncbi:MAG: DNA repair protein RecO [Pseudobutyrivibrio sp.]|nr:DNA repair protein RecO [Pseudobutyrivibrio sp.]